VRDTEKDEKQLKIVLGRLLSQRLDRSNPLWMVYDIRGFADGSSALFVVVHHALADGQGSIRALLAMGAQTDGVDLRKTQYGQAEKQLREMDQRKKEGGIWERSLGSYTRAFFAWFLRFLGFLVAVLYIYFEYVLISLHRKRSMVTPLTTSKAVTWSKPVSLMDVKFIKNVFGVTVNDVLVSALTAAFRSYLLGTDQLRESDVLVSIPVSVRRLDDWEMGNKVCTLWLSIPVKEEDSIERLKTVQRRMDRLKSLPFAAIQYFNMRALGAIPGLLSQPRVRGYLKWLMSKAHILMTNVPGPKVPVIMAGQEINTFIPFVPQPGSGGLGVALISYCDQVVLSILTDTGQLMSCHPTTKKAVVSLEDAFFDEIQHLKTLAEHHHQTKTKPEEGRRNA